MHFANHIFLQPCYKKRLLLAKSYFWLLNFLFCEFEFQSKNPKNVLNTVFIQNTLVAHLFSSNFLFFDCLYAVEDRSCLIPLYRKIFFNLFSKGRTSSSLATIWFSTINVSQWHLRTFLLSTQSPIDNISILSFWLSAICQSWTINPLCASFFPVYWLLHATFLQNIDRQNIFVFLHLLLNRFKQWQCWNEKNTNSRIDGFQCLPLLVPS